MSEKPRIALSGASFAWVAAQTPKGTPIATPIRTDAIVSSIV